MALREFRTGWDDIPDHLDAIMDFDTRNMSFEEATAMANARMLQKVLDKTVTRMRTEHFRGIHQEVPR